VAFELSATGRTLLVVNLAGYPLVFVAALHRTVNEPKTWQRPLAGLALCGGLGLQAQVDLMLLAVDAAAGATEQVIVIDLLKKSSAVGTLELLGLPSVGRLLGPLPFTRLLVVAFGTTVALVVLAPVKIGLAMLTAGGATTLLPSTAKLQAVALAATELRVMFVRHKILRAYLTWSGWLQCRPMR
jgi:hypothetical protein